MQATASLCIFVITISGAGQVSDKPDFSGRWVLVNSTGSAPDVPLALKVRQTIVTKTVRGDPMEPFFKDLVVVRQFKSGARSESYQIGIEGGVVGGVDRTGRGSGPNGQVPRTYFAVRWAGNSLVIDTGSYSGATKESGPYTEHTEVWQLDARGRLVMTVTDRRSGVEPTTRTLTYRRR